MQQINESIRLSAGDLGKHLACRHLTELDRAAAEKRLPSPPLYPDPLLERLKERGFEHESAYVEHLVCDGRDVVRLHEFEGDDAVARTIEAMRWGAGVIVQARLQDGRWLGYADILLRVDTPSALGDWSYEVIDTKLAQETKAATILQLSLYSELVGGIQGHPPKCFHVVTPGEGFPRETFRVADFGAYYRLVKRNLEAAVDAPPATDTYPYPVGQCAICRWWKHCDDQRHEDDHLSIVAGIRSTQTAELERQGILTLEGFALETTPLREKPERGSMDGFASAQAQARVQLEGRRRAEPVHELIEFEEGRGLARLPAPDGGDVFFDIEGDHFAEDGGLEYLFGWAVRDASGQLVYERRWALDRAAEKRVFEAFIDTVMERWAAHPGMHVYHFAPYEPGAMKRLAMRHATREEEVDRLLRGERFVDLYRVTRQGVRASVERYSIKDLEPFFGFERAIGLREASAARRSCECAIEQGVATSITPEERALVEGYNRDDCLATEGLQRWLEECRQRLIDGGQAVERPPLEDGLGSEEAEERKAEVEAVFRRLVDGLPEDRDAWTNEEAARWLLAHELEYFRREDKCAWWEFFRMAELEPSEYFDDRGMVAELNFADVVDGGTARCPIHRYRFPSQDLAIKRGGTLHALDPDDASQPMEIGTIEAIDVEARTIDVKKRQKARDHHPTEGFAFDLVRSKPLPESLLALAESAASLGVDGDGQFRAARDLLLKRTPRLASGSTEPLRRPDEETVAAAKRLVGDLDRGVLAIQGPPGTGKTFTGAHVITDLIKQGKRVGVTAVSHKVIRNLLDKTLEIAAEQGVPLEAVHKGGRPSDDLPAGLEVTSSNDDAIAALDDGKVVGGTAWLWARDDAMEKLDYLFVDEAGQMSLALVLAAGRCAHNIVLLGDPQQLEQPQQGSHPEGAEVAALVHMLDGHKTIPNDRGLFLDMTWRLHPDLCSFTSELYYEGRLTPHKDLHRQVLSGDSPFEGGALAYAPVEHEGNQTRSTEEVEAVAAIIEHLLDAGVEWTNREGEARPLTPDDFRVVAPYNDQVGALTERLGDIPVGTVDKFQGQEAPVVIYSMTTSTAADAPRGLGFLYSPNRLNVATSRAQCTCILVASPGVLEAECRTPEQMRWVNGVCRFRELAREVGVGAAIVES